MSNKMIWFTLALFFFPGLYANIQLAARVSINEGTLWLFRIQSPSDYELIGEDQHFQRISISETFISREMASDLASKFPKWKNLEAINFSKCAWKDSASEIMANALVSNPNINRVRSGKEYLSFLPDFIEALCQSEPYLKELDVIFEFGCREIGDEFIQFDDRKLERAFSLLENVTIYSSYHCDKRFARKILSAMKNLKNIYLFDEFISQPGLLTSLNSLENVEKFFTTFKEESFNSLVQIISQMPNLHDLELQFLENEDFNVFRVEGLLSKAKNLKIFKLSGFLNCIELLPKLKKLTSLQKVTLPVILEGERNLKLNKSDLTFFNAQEYPFEVKLELQTRQENGIEVFTTSSSEAELTANDQSTGSKAKNFVDFLPKGIVNLTLRFEKVNAEFLTLFWDWLQRDGKDVKCVELYISATQQEYLAFESSIGLFSKSYNVKVSNSFPNSLWIEISKN